MRRALKGKDIGTIPPWSGIAQRNSVDPRRVPGALLIAQAEDDPLVASGVTRAFVAQRCSTGLPLRWVPIPGGDHANSARNSAEVTLSWLADRFAGKSAPSDCGKL
jgi:hypothetical protein